MNDEERQKQSEPKTTAVAKMGAAGVKDLLAQPAYASRFNEIMNKRAPQFMASIIAVARSLPEDTDPQSIVSAAMVAATLDLPVNKDLGFSWIVPYRNKGIMQAQFQMGHKGFIQLALRTGQYGGMNAKPINTEAFGGYDSIGEPIIHWDKVDESKEIIGYAFAWKLVGGFTKVAYWKKARVEAHASRYSQAYSKGLNSPWKTHFNEMALKTVIKNELSDWGMLSVEMRQGMKFDQGVVIDVDSEKVEYPDNSVTVVESPKREGPPRSPLKKKDMDSETILNGLRNFMLASGISEDQVIGYLNSKGQTEKDCLVAVADDTIVQLIKDWSSIKDEIASIQI